jgi:hypothetical protein
MFFTKKVLLAFAGACLSATIVAADDIPVGGFCECRIYREFNQSD